MAGMSRPELWTFLKDMNWTPTKKYQEYTTAELSEIYDDLVKTIDRPAPPLPSSDPLPASEPSREAAPEPHGETIDVGPVETPTHGGRGIPTADGGMKAPFYTGIEGVAGTKPSNLDHEEVIEVDGQGRRWLQKEVKKKANFAPRGRRKVTYNNTGTERVVVKNSRGDSETIEMPGDRLQKGEARVTLPSFQVGIYRTDKFPFKVYVYNGVEGFDLFEVRKYYGGEQLVPDGVKTIYVNQVLCYDMRSVINAIRAEASELRLAGGRKQ